MERGDYMGHEHITSYIPIGKENAIHLTALATLANMSESGAKRAIRANREDTIILSGRNGYWLPESREEGSAWLFMMKKQAISRLATIKHTRKVLKEIPEQLVLDIPDITGKGE